MLLVSKNKITLFCVLFSCFSTKIELEIKLMKIIKLIFILKKIGNVLNSLSFVMVDIKNERYLIKQTC